jgi:ribonuclease Z
MSWLKISLLSLLVVAVAGGTGLALFQDRIALAVLDRAFARGLASDPFAGLPDGLHVGLCGTGSPMPDPTRAGPCTAVLAGQRLFIIDAGAGSPRVLNLMRLPPGRIEAVLLTHYHSDHIDGLGELLLQRWTSSAARAPLPVHGPPGVEQVVEGLARAYALDRGYRIAHHGPDVVPPEGSGGAARAFTAPPGGLVVLRERGLKITAFAIAHDPVEPAVGYRFDYKGRSVVISGDTALSPAVESMSRGVDLLVHEALAPNMVAMQRDAAMAAGRRNLAKIFEDIVGYHTTPEAAAGIAARAGAKSLVFTHIVPPLPVRALERPWLGRSREVYSGPLRVGRDGDFATLPAAGGPVRWTNRLDAPL